MDRYRRNDQRGGRGSDRGRGDRSQPSRRFQNLRKALPPENVPTVQVPKWAVDSLEMWVPQMRSAIVDGKSPEASREMMDQYLSKSMNAYWTAIQIAAWSMDEIQTEENDKKRKLQVTENPAEESNSQVDKNVFEEDTCNSHDSENKAKKLQKNAYEMLQLLAMTALSDQLAGGQVNTRLLNDNIKIYAFCNVLEKARNELFQEVLKIYQFKSNPEMFLGHIQQALAEQKYAAAARAVGQLDLQDQFKIPEILFPLVMLNRLGNIIRFLDSASAEKSTELVKFLDALLGEKQTVITDLVKRLEISEVKKEHLCKKHITRCCTRLADNYKVPTEFWKTAQQERMQSLMMFLIMKRYADQGIPVEDWEEILCGFVKSNQKLGRTAIIRMAYKDDLVVAASCAQKWRIEVRTLPPLVRDALRSGELIPKDENNRVEQKPKPTNFYAPEQLFMPPIQIVDNKETFDCFISKIKEAEMVGMDSEWRPVFLGDVPKIALLQLATKDNVYLLDILTLQSDALMAGKWSDMEKALFANENVLKLGFALEGDWNVVEAIDPSLQGLQQKLVNVLDLRILCQNESIFHFWNLSKSSAVHSMVLKNNPDVFPSYDGNPPARKGLANYVELCFGAPLDKHQQFSNWEKRPLRDAQVKYAALDAFCLLDIYATLKSECLKTKLDFDALCIKEDESKLPKEMIDKDAESYIHA